MIFSKKINILLFTSLIMQQAVAGDYDRFGDLNLPFVHRDGIDYKSGIGAFVGTYVGMTAGASLMYLYFSLEAEAQENNQSINHDVIEDLKSKCLNNGVVIDHVYYNPNLPIRGNAAVLPTPFGNLLFLGSGYGASKNEPDVVPLTPEQIDFIMGHECCHVLHNDIQNRKLFISSWMSLTSSKAVSDGYSPLFILGFFKLCRHQEYNADYYASTDTEVVKGGIDWFKIMYNKEQYQDILSRISSKIVHMFFATHPCNRSRYSQLELRFRELQKAKQAL